MDYQRGTKFSVQGASLLTSYVYGSAFTAADMSAMNVSRRATADAGGIGITSFTTKLQGRPTADDDYGDLMTINVKTGEQQVEHAVSSGLPSAGASLSTYGTLTFNPPRGYYDFRIGVKIAGTPATGDKVEAAVVTSDTAAA